MCGSTGAADATIGHYIAQIERCIDSRHLKLGKVLHSRLLKSALALHTLLANRLVDMYAKCGSFASARAAFDDIPVKNYHSWNTMLAAYSRAGDLLTARDMFDEMPDRNIVTYNTMISSLTHHGHHREALQFFLRMRNDGHYGPLGITMDKFTIVGAVTACADLACLASLRQIHGAVIATGLELNLIMSNVLIDAYGKCGDLNTSRLVFDQMGTRDVVSWTSLVRAYARAHRLEDACQTFDRMPVRNAVSWTALISSHEQNEQEEAALDLFERMMEEGIGPTPFTLVSVLSACASLGLIARGKQIHGYIIRRNVGCDSSNLFTYNALIDMYAKCGDMGLATALFKGMTERDQISWNSIITGFAQNGQGKQALAAFENMTEAGVKPTDVTFLGVLSACSHAGLVDEGRRLLESMEKEYCVDPRPEHYAAFIDALGRNYRFGEAIGLIESLPSTGGSGSVGSWGALLGACQVHGDLKLAKRAAESLFVLDPENGARYVTLSNIYSAAGQWDEARRVRVLMKGKGLRKDPGCSWIEVRSVKHMFVAEDKWHFQMEEIYGMLAMLVDQMSRLIQMEGSHDLLSNQS